MIWAPLTALILLFPSVVADQEQLAEVAQRIIDHQEGRSRAYEILTELCDDVGHRISGSPQADAAVDWAVATFRHFNITVKREPVMVQRWIRGDVEEVVLVAPRHEKLRALALGGSIATPGNGIEAEVLVVETAEELQQRASEAEGKIVLFNRAMGPDGEGNVLGYGDVVGQRTRGAIDAAKVGAVASIIRSVGTADYRLPHTGAMRYEDGVRKIPHAAVSTEDANLIARLVERDREVRVRMRLDCRSEGMVPSANVIGEIRGRERPEEVIVIAAHLDSWDVGQGAHDDGTGVAACIESLRLISELELRPRRTIRAVLYMNEENGLAGGRAYAEDYINEMPDHVAAIEMDGGAFQVQGFGVSGGDGAFEIVEEIARHLAPIGADSVKKGGGGADISPMRKYGVPQLNLRSDTTPYWYYHHTEADTLDKVDARELARCTAALAFLAYALAESDETLPRLE